MRDDQAYRKSNKNVWMMLAVGNRQAAIDVLEGDIARLKANIEACNEQLSWREETLAAIRVSHAGDPCVYCGQQHDEVAPGPCPGAAPSNIGFQRTGQVAPSTVLDGFMEQQGETARR